MLHSWSTGAATTSTPSLSFAHGHAAHVHAAPLGGGHNSLGEQAAYAAPTRKQIGHHPTAKKKKKKRLRNVSKLTG
jgi:hypothetical protein